MRRPLALLLALCAVAAEGESRYGESNWALYLELDQMLVLNVGTEYSLSRNWGVRGGVGVTLFGFATAGYELVGVYHFMEPDRQFQCDLEFGLPVAYFNALEGNVVDWDPQIDSPFAGWAPGMSLVWGYRLARGSVVSLKTGALVPFEYGRDSGWRDSINVLPEFALQWLF